MKGKIADLGRGPAHLTALTCLPPPSSALPIVLRLSTVGSHPLLPFCCHGCRTIMPITIQAFHACLHLHLLLLKLTWLLRSCSWYRVNELAQGAPHACDQSVRGLHCVLTLHSVLLLPL